MKLFSGSDGPDFAADELSMLICQSGRKAAHAI
jgi:hypothetical protein